MSNLKLTFTSVEKQIIIKHLAKDKKLETLIKSIPFPEVKLNKNLYASLVEAIISQQLSIAAAKTIHTRFLALFNHTVPSPQSLLSCDNNFLRTAGISNQKAGYLKNIAAFALQNSLNFIADFGYKYQRVQFTLDYLGYSYKIVGNTNYLTLNAGIQF